MNRKIEIIALIFSSLLLLAASSTAQTWSQLSTVGSPPTTGIGGSGYDSTNNRLIVFFPSQSGAQVWVLTNANGLGGTASWTQLAPTGTAPAETYGASVVYDSITNQLIVYGGCVAFCGGPLSNVFVLSNASGLGGTPAWSQNTTSPSEAREEQSAVYNSSTKQMIAFGGGLGFYGTDENDTRVLFPANGTTSNWTTLTPLGGPPGIREGQNAVYDQTHNVMTIFGGIDLINTCCPYNQSNYNDVWVLSNADGTGSGTPTWTQLAPTGTAPPARSGSSAVYDSGKNIMYVFGGGQWSNASQSTTTLGDLWKLTNANGRSVAAPKWTQIGQLGTPPGANSGQAAAFDRKNQRMIIFGGSDRNSQQHNLTFILDLLQH